MVFDETSIPKFNGRFKVEVALSENFPEWDDDNNEVVGIETTIDEISVITMILTKNGEIYLYKHFTEVWENSVEGDDISVEAIGKIEGGILSYKVSQDEEMMVIATGLNTLMVMKKDFDFTLDHIQTIELSDHVKDHAENTGIVPQISWREDGEYFTVNYIDGYIQRIDTKTKMTNYKINVFTRSGDLESIAENPTEGGIHRSSKVTYRPDGRLIASSEYDENQEKNNIIFFEKNGLQHYNFELLKGKKVNVKQLQWNIDNEVLMVIVENEEKTSVQLWYRENYHWYKKLEHLMEDRISFATWDKETALKLHTVQENGQYNIFEYVWEVDSMEHLDKTNPMVIGVIDNQTLKLTPMKYVTTPPPMATCEIQTEAAIQQIAFAPSGKTFFVQLINGDVLSYGIDVVQAPPEFGLPPTLKKKVSLPLGRHLTALSDDTFVLVETHCEFKDEILLYNVNTEKLQRLTIDTLRLPVYGLAYRASDNLLFVQGQSGALWQATPGKPFERHTLDFGSPCPIMRASVFNLDHVVIGRSTQGLLYVNDQVITPECVSFNLHKEYLLWTNYQHQLRIIPSIQGLAELSKLAKAKVDETYDETCRAVERGGQLITVSPDGMEVLLQMPRGNLERIYPKLLALRSIVFDLKEANYGEALAKVRKFKIDFDFLYDYNPTLLENNVKTIIDQAESLSHINIFLSSVSNTNSILSKYKVFNERNATNVDYPDKVNKIMSMFRDVLLELNHPRYITSLLTTYVRMDPPQYADALSHIRTLDRDAANRAINYLKYLVDIRKLYRIALGMHDFSLVLMIAQMSQMDPKEYLPFISQLQKEPKPLAYFHIHSYLEEFNVALSHIATYDALDSIFIDEVLPVISEHALYDDAIKFFGQNQSVVSFDDGSHSIHDVLYLSYGRYLMNGRDLRLAGYSFLECNDLDLALNAFATSGSYSETVALVVRMKLSPSDSRSTFETLLSTLNNKFDFLTAARVLDEQLNRHEEAIEKLCTQHQWNAALLIAAKNNRRDLLTVDIKDNLKTETEEIMDQLDEESSKFEKYIKRLVALREEKVRAYYEQLEAEGNDLDDTLSETDSIFSQTSTYSGVSMMSTLSFASSIRQNQQTRNKKKREKLKKGSPFEEENLIKRLYSLLPRLPRQKLVHNFLEHLLFFQLHSLGNSLQQKLDSFIALVRKHKTLLETEFYTLGSMNNKGGDVPEPLKVNPENIDPLIEGFDYRFPLFSHASTE